MSNQYILAIDQGTSSTKTLLFDQDGRVAARASVPLKTFYLDQGFVEQDPEELWQNVISSVDGCLNDFRNRGGDLYKIRACGISNQRETFVVWDKEGRPLHRAVVWQCKRSVAICERWKQEGLQLLIQAKTGLLIDPYFSGSKMVWLRQEVEAVARALADGHAYFGTIDTWMLYKLSNGESYLTDYTNASRTLFFNLQELCWDQELLRLFGLFRLQLPQLQPSSSHFGHTDLNGLLSSPIPITGMTGDSHAAAFGEACFAPGTAKATLGTGCSILMNTGEMKPSGSGMVSTICWSTQQRVDYAQEGVIVSCGATIEWLKNELHLFSDHRETEQMAHAVAGNGGVYLVPAFSGLGAPHWDMNRRASITGLTFGCNKHHIVRAALESIAYQIKDVIEAMQMNTGIQLEELMVNGGITSNQFVLQFLADLLEKPVILRNMPDISALGAAWLAGLQAGVFTGLDHLKEIGQQRSEVHPRNNPEIKGYYEGWKKAVGQRG